MSYFQPPKCKCFGGFCYRPVSCTERGGKRVLKPEVKRRAIASVKRRADASPRSERTSGTGPYRAFPDDLRENERVWREEEAR